ncbi:hypothetical protein [Halorarum halobium]|uniref:hypothetical protein n=1 Tax=Halorarum halobium TaxID=3075121 RepID=UPI0028AF197E|nr:hypothetical protein [Halobaculum sp. XH14]
MSLVSALKDALASGDGGADAVRYRCGECGTGFDRARTRMVRTRCPDCGSADLRVVEEP